MNSGKLDAKDTIHIQSDFGLIETYSDDLITKQIQKYGNHTRPEFAFALSAIDPTMNVFDLGCHIGTFSMAVLRKLRQGQRLLSVEGSPITAKIALHNLIRQGHARFDLKVAFVGGDESLTFNENTENTGGSSLRQTGIDDPNNTVETVSIDKLTQTYFAPDYIKIDIEGAEYSALSQSQYIRDKKPILYAEVSSLLENLGHTKEMLDEFLQNLGYQFFVNVGFRNAPHDFWRAKQLNSIVGYKDFFDVLCIHKDDPKARYLGMLSD